MYLYCALFWLLSVTHFKILNLTLSAGGVRILADFVRKHRPFSAALRQTSPYKPSACGCSGSFQSALLVCMKAQVMADDDVDDMCDAYVPLGE